MNISSNKSSKFRTDVVNETGAKIRSFLYELAEGTSNYRSLHNLTEQVEHQYHGRFLIELLQNAHDALNEKPTLREPCRIEILLDSGQGPFGTLYVANDGHPFSESNFKSLSQLGQSDKDPQASIGNKGIGFRSVLEITSSPEIYSRRVDRGPTFNGYCFGFSRSVIDKFRIAIARLLNGEDKVSSPLDDSTSLVDQWGPDLLHKLRFTLKPKGAAWLENEMRYLSPYLLPYPIVTPSNDLVVRDYEQRGFATVIRFPLKSSSATELTRAKIEELEAESVLFLERAKSLVLTSGTTRRELKRKLSCILPGCHNGHEIMIQDTVQETPRKYWMWNESIRVSEAPEEFQQAIKDLPGKWPDLKEATVMLAVRVAETPGNGVFSIFLPTEMTTGTGAYVNASFYGDMSRTDIDLKKDYNGLLLRYASRMAIDIIMTDLAGHGVDESRAIVDIIAPKTTEESAAGVWFNAIKEEIVARQLAPADIEIFLADTGWFALKDISFIRAIEDPSVMTEQVLRKHAHFPCFVSEMDTRRELLENLFEAVSIGEYPSDEDMASTVESLASEMGQLGGNADWNGFWTDSIKLFDGDSKPLRGKSVLFGTDNALHASGENCSVFFIPRRGTSDEDETLSENAAHQIPTGLKDSVAFLHDSIQVYDKNDARIRTDIHKFLDTNLVQQFRVEDILVSVLMRKTPKLPAVLRSPEGAMCADIILWGLQLVSGLVERGLGDKTTRLLQSLPVPCRGGWYELREASFGPGWLNTLGECTYDYLRQAGSYGCAEATKRILLPPSDKLWNGVGETHQALLRRAGVFDGVRLIGVDPTAWQAKFLASRDSSFLLPEGPPPGIPPDVWLTYRSYIQANIRLTYGGWFYYEILGLMTIPGFDNYANFSDAARRLFTQVVFGSIANWGDSWAQASIKKTDGNPDRAVLASPLAHALKTLAWLGIESDGKVDWSRPSDRWYVTSGQLSGRPRQFAHLKPLPGGLAQVLDGNSVLAEALLKLGMPKFDIETRSESTRLLDDLAGSLTGDISEFNVFLGQVRDAWRAFDPKEAGRFPRAVVAKRGNAPLFALTPTMEKPVYLPDSSASFMASLEQFSLPVIAIDTLDAKRLANGFKRSYPEGVQLASEIEMVPLINGERWQRTPGMLLSESELDWVIPTVLSLVAFSGVQAKGTNAKPFLERAQVFQEATVCWVSSLEVGLFKADRKIASPSVPAIWLDKWKTLIVDEICRENPSLLSEAISNMVNREDLELPIKLTLKELDNCDPDQQDIVRSLGQLKIDESGFLEVLERWRGDLGQLIRMIRPIVILLKPDIDTGRMLELETEDSLVSFLDQQGFELFDGKSILAFARKARDRYELGANFYKSFGPGAQLAAWNKLLLGLGETPLANENAEAEFRDHLASAYLPLCSLLATILRRRPEMGFFKPLSDNVNAVQCPENYAGAFWEVGFHQTMLEVTCRFRQWQATPSELKALESANSSSELLDNLVAAGIDTDFDPFRVFSDNLEKVKDSLRTLQRAGVCWCLRQKGIDPTPWERDSDSLVQEIVGQLEKMGFTAKLTDGDVFNLLKMLPRHSSHASFWQCLDGSNGIRDALTALGITDEDLETARAKLDDYKEEQRRRKRLVGVCGGEFDNSEENLSALWSHICGQLNDERLGLLESVDFHKFAKIGKIGARSKKKRTTIKPRVRGPKPRLTKSMEELIGLAAEIHAFRMLQRTYGTAVVHQLTWISRNSNYVFANNETDDGRGCDFIIHYSGTTFYIEVKGSQGDDDTFKLGSSEIDLARELTAKRRKHKEIFLVLHVTNALSEEPAFRLLPNPYDAKYQSMFMIEDADTRVRYKPEK